MSDVTSFINGLSVDSDESYNNIDPSTGAIIGTVAKADAELVDLAVRTARTAFDDGWRESSPEVRSTLLCRLADLIDAHREELAVMESEDTGKPLTQARTDATVCARYFRFYGHTIEAFYGITIPLTPDFHVYTRREPHGVAGAIIAWNYPMQLLGRAVAPALATGNCSVLKPADETPRSAVRIAELAIEAGFAPGVFNVVTGLGPETGQLLSEHPGIDHLGFVGSTEVGKRIAAQAAERVIPVVLELGGKSPHIVFADADLEQAALFITKGILQNAGQTCSAGSRLIVHKDVKDELLELLVAKFEAVTIGAGGDDKDLGPLVSVKQQNRVRTFVDEAEGTILTGGTVPAGFEAGAFYSPTLIADVDPASKIAQQEVFGPVLVAMEFETEEEAVAMANSTDYALMAAIWTRDVSRVHRLAAKVEAGQVYVNAYGAGGGVELPFGGFKKSGYGREKGYEALAGYTQTKTVAIKL